MKYGFIYETTDLMTGKKYIGQHKRVQNPKDPDDSWYLGSGTLITTVIEMKGKDKFSRKILCECDSPEELNEKEEYYLTKVNAAENPDYYNRTNSSDHSVCAGMHLPEEWRKHMSESQKKRPPMSVETREKIRRANLGKHHSEETKRKIGAYHKGKRLSESHRKAISESLSGEKHPMYGRHYTPEERARQSQAQKERFSKTPQHNKGVPCSEEQKESISNTLKNLWKDEDYRKRMSDSHKDKVWMHNSEQHEKVYISIEEVNVYERLGWRRGRGNSLCKRIN